MTDQPINCITHPTVKNHYKNNKKGNQTTVAATNS